MSTGMEPHSALPVALPIVFNPYSPVLPDQLKSIHGVASSMCFRVPLVRHLWWWLGIRPVSKTSILNILSSGKSVVLVPGGVQEIQHMRPDREVIFLKRRHGFVKLAMQSGTPLLPVFVFGQSQTYLITKSAVLYLPEITKCRFGFPKRWRDAIGRRIGIQPTWLYGRWGTTVPHRVPMLVIIGTPIPVPQQSQPNRETVQEYLDLFIRQMQDLFEAYKTEAGTPDLELDVL